MTLQYRPLGVNRWVSLRSTHSTRADSGISRNLEKYGMRILLGYRWFAGTR
jgi:hypothetical protein